MGAPRRAKPTFKATMRTLAAIPTTYDASNALELLHRCCRGPCRRRDGGACERPVPLAFGPVTKGGLEGDASAFGEAGTVPGGPAGWPVRKHNRVRLLMDGADTYEAMLGLVQRAQSEILFENFIFRADAVGRAFADALRSRAEAGVAVWVLHDAFGSLMSRRASIAPRFRGSPVKIRAYNPPRPTSAFFRSGRDHRKLVVADRRAAIVGGLCLADAWLGNCITRCTWRDAALLIEGEASRDAAQAFEQMWPDTRILDSALPAAARSAFGEGAAETPGTVPVRVIADMPGERRVERLLIQTIDGARHEVLITNPYVLPPRPLMDALVAAASRGVRVQLIVPLHNNHAIVGLASEHVLGPLLEAGVQVWRWTGPMIHAKTVVIDRCWALVGSTNLDGLSLRRNAEIDVEVHGDAVGRRMAAVFLRDRLRSLPFTHDDWSRRSQGRRWASAIAATARPWL